VSSSATRAAQRTLPPLLEIGLGQGSRKYRRHAAKAAAKTAVQKAVLQASEPNEAHNWRTDIAAAKAPTTAKQSEFSGPKKKEQLEYPPELMMVYNEAKARETMAKAVKKSRVQKNLPPPPYSKANANSLPKHRDNPSPVKPVLSNLKGFPQRKTDKAKKGLGTATTAVASLKKHIHSNKSHKSTSAQALRNGKELLVAGSSTPQIAPEPSLSPY